jgi:WD40 repeat protein
VPGWIVTVRFTRDGTNAVGRAFDGAVRVWNVASGSIVQSFSGQGSGLNVALADDLAISGSEDGTLAAWDLSGARRLGRAFRWRAPSAGCPATPCFVIDGRGSVMAESMADGRIGLVDVRAQRLIDTLPARNGAGVDALAFFPDSRRLATGGTNGKVTIWDVRKRAVVRSLRLRDHVWRVAVSPNGKLLATQTQADGGSSSRVEVRNLTSGKVLFRRAVSDGKGGLDFSPDGRRLVALGCCDPGSTIKVWAARSGRLLFSPRVEGHATSIAFAPDGRLLAAGTEDGKVVLWHADTGSRVGTPIEVATGAVDPISFSPDGSLFAVSSSDLTTTLWDLRTRRRLGDAFPVEQGSIPVARFASGGDLVIDNLTDTARWPTDVRAWARFACRVAGRDLTSAEWRELLPERRFRRVCG